MFLEGDGGFVAVIFLNRVVSSFVKKFYLFYFILIKMYDVNGSWICVIFLSVLRQIFVEGGMYLCECLNKNDYLLDEIFV